MTPLLDNGKERNNSILAAFWGLLDQKTIVSKCFITAVLYVLESHQKRLNTYKDVENLIIINLSDVLIKVRNANIRL